MGLLMALALAVPCAAGQAAAMDVPSGVIAFATDDASQAHSGGTLCSGSLVVISPDGMAITLAEALPADPAPDAQAAPDSISSGAAAGSPQVGRRLTVVLPGGRTRSADIVRRGTTTTAVLVHIDDLPADCQPLAFADPRALAPGDAAWTAGNACGAVELDGAAALSHGVIGGLYDLPADAPPVRGRGGKILSAYRGQVIETDAAVNDGSQGGALLDADGRCIGLMSLAEARERRLGTAVPIHLVLSDLGLSPPMSPASTGDSWAHAAAQAAGAVALVYLERPDGLGNPNEIPRPPRAVDEVPPFDRDRMQNWWDMYYHQQQVFYTDQPVSALVIDAKAGLMVTAVSNLHGGAEHGHVLVGPEQDIDCALVAVDRPHDLALLKAAAPLPLADAVFATASPAVGEPVAVVGRHRRDGFTVGSGVISARDRHLEQSAVGWLQTDARADYGSLGGALIDRQGKVTAMVALLAPDHNDWLINSGVAMAIGADAIKAALPGLEGGTSHLDLPTLGLGVVIENQDGHELVHDVTAGTGAAEAGIQAGDIIVSVDGHPASSSAAMSRAILRHHLGERVAVVLDRAGKTLAVTVQLREFNRDPE